VRTSRIYLVSLQTARNAMRNLRDVTRSGGWIALLVLAVLLPAFSLPAQQGEKPKVPGLDKILNAQEHLAYTGTIKLVDEKRNTISIDSVEGGNTEIFPIKHNTFVLGSDGYRKKLSALSPGTKVIVYYEQRSDKRMVTRIEMLPAESKKEEPHS